MKKTIAILLVLVIGMAGVFAADTSPAIAELDLTTTIDLVFRTKLVANQLTSPDFTNFEAASTLLTSQPVDLNTTNFGYLYIMTNNADGYVLSISAQPLVSTGIATSIDYKISAGGASYDTADTGAATTVTSSAISALDVDEYTVSVDLDDTTYNAALPASYTADVSFIFTAQ